MSRKEASFILAAFLFLAVLGCGKPSGSGTSSEGAALPNGLTLQDSYSTAGPTADWIGHVELVDLAERVAVTRSYKITAVQLSMYNMGSPNQNIAIGIYSHDAANDQPGSLIGNWSTSVNNADFPRTPPGNPVLFTGLNAPVTAGTYWIVMHPVSGTGDNTGNYSIVSGTNTTHHGECHYNKGWDEFMDAQVIFSFYSGKS